MITISQIVEDILRHDNIASIAANKGWLNLSSYARSIRRQVEAELKKDVQEGSIITTLSRITSQSLEAQEEDSDMIQSFSVHSNLEGMSYERSEKLSVQIRELYHQAVVNNKAFLTVTQGINEVTIVAESNIAQTFREKLKGSHTVYDRTGLVGITVKFTPESLEVPNLIFKLTRRLAYEDIGIVEIVSTATELTYIIDKNDLTTALGQLQKNI